MLSDETRTILTEGAYHLAGFNDYDTEISEAINELLSLYDAAIAEVERLKTECGYLTEQLEGFVHDAEERAYRNEIEQSLAADYKRAQARERYHAELREEIYGTPDNPK